MTPNVRDGKSLLVGSILGLFSIASAACAGGTANSNLAARTNATLDRQFPAMRIVQSADVKLPECTHQRMDGPGFVTADFNGDGIQDVAVLLISRAPERVEKWEGKDWPVHEVQLVVLLGRKDGSFEAKSLYEHEDFLPTIFGLRVQMPKELREVGTERRVSMSKPGVMLYACEKFSVVHFYEGGKFKSLGIDG